MPIDRIRDVLYNIEQFKGDALKLPNISNNALVTKKERGMLRGTLKQTGSSDQAAAGVYGDAAKSAGSLNDKTS